jgi:hypothetical protein
VLYTLCVAMAPFSPYFTEHVFQNLRLVLPEGERVDSMKNRDSLILRFVTVVSFSHRLTL